MEYSKIYWVKSTYLFHPWCMQVVITAKFKPQYNLTSKRHEDVLIGNLKPWYNGYYKTGWTFLNVQHFFKSDTKNQAKSIKNQGVCLNYWIPVQR